MANTGELDIPKPVAVAIAEAELGMFGLLFHRVKKIIAHLITGKSTLERILLSSSHSSEMTIVVRTSILLSKQLKHLRCIIFRPEPFEVADVLHTILRRKNIQCEEGSRAYENLRSCLRQLNNLNYVIQRVLILKDETYSSQKLEHEELLEKLWATMKPEVRRTGGRITTEWTEIGFQGKDPSTDFRGMGILALQQLVYFADNYVEESRQALVDSSHPVRWYPFSVLGINITSFLIDLNYARLMDYAVLDKLKLVDMTPEEVTQIGLAQLNRVYSEMFIAFNKFWVDSEPEDLMQFPRMFSIFKARMRSDAVQSSFIYW